MSAHEVLIYVDTIHNINLPRLQDNVMRFVALSPTRTAAKTAAPNMNPPNSHPTATLVVWSSQSFSETRHKELM